MLGHSTRIVQQASDHWHDGEDEILAHYVDQSRHADRLNILALALLPQGWLIAGFAAASPAMITGTAFSGQVAAEIGAILLGYTALRGLAAGLSSLTTAAIALERSRPFLAASQRVEAPGDSSIAADLAPSPSTDFLELREISYRHPDRSSNAVSRATVRIGHGDHVLLTGASGSGKSTWVALASGLRTPDSGLLFLHGIDRTTLGDRSWRRRVAVAPQFHENHIFSGTLAFNLLLGRNWPPEPGDLREAQELRRCRQV